MPHIPIVSTVIRHIFRTRNRRVAGAGQTSAGHPPQHFCRRMLPWIQLCLAVALSSGPAVANTCTPPVTSPPCSPGSTASLADSEPSLNLGAGNPVHLATGAKHQADTDLPASAAHPGLEIVRHYNSMRTMPSPLGTGWRLSYDTRLVVRPAGVQIDQADGGQIRFDAQTDPARYGHLRRHDNGWAWTWPQGRRLDFDPDGYLIRILPPGVDDPGSTQAVHILRHDAPGPLTHAIRQVRSGDGTLSLSYRIEQGTVMLSGIDSPAGRFLYHIELAMPGTRLRHMARPDGMRRQYLYEPGHQSGNAALPTGIVLAMPAQDGKPGKVARVSAWDYDAAGRATGASYGERTHQHGYSRIQYARQPGPDRHGVTLVDGPAGRTQLTFLQQGERYLLLRVDGAGCPGCAAPGTLARYDAAGRLLSFRDIQLQRDATSGHITTLLQSSGGWPGLNLTFLPSGARVRWHTSLTGQETTAFDPSGRPTQRQFSNGDTITMDYDAQGRLKTIRESQTVERPDGHDPAPSSAATPLLTRLRWHDNGQLAGIDHPAASEQRHHDAAGNVASRSETRPRQGTTPAWQFTEHFRHDAAGRMTRHQLPEGGALHYTWGQNRQLLGLQWEDRQGKRHIVLETTPGQPGYRFGNGLQLTVAGQGSPTMALSLTRGDTLLWRQLRHQDSAGRVLHESHAFPGLPTRQQERWRYAYDQASRLVVAQPRHAPPALWLAWHPDGALAASTQTSAQGVPTTTQRPDVRRDASGLPTHADTLSLSYGPDRRLSAVSSKGQELVRYVHNAFGQRIRQTMPSGHAIDYLYLNNRRVADTHPTTHDQRPRVARRYLYANDAPVGIIDYDLDGHGVLHAVHADLLGAPRMVTDHHGNLRWLAHYSPLGAAHRVAGDLTLDMRLPGQWYDALTGWHDNLLRTYVPQWGQYLEPDPLGPVPGSQALGYAAQQPRRFVDPLGLLLFAFDGTRQTARTHSNVWKLAQQYLDGAAFYHGGPGNPYYLDLDAAIAYRAPQILQTQWQHLLNALAQAGSQPSSVTPAPIPIDVIGFSRGAALARHFGNMVASHTSQGLFSYQDSRLGLVSACVNLRFMGLMDTVAQFGTDGAHNNRYDLRIDEAWQWVAHAVALHEHRWLFPLTSANDAANQNVVQAPFIGAHADIGGGNLLDGSSSRQGDLHDVVLNWMWWQARAASVGMHTPAPDDQSVTDPVLHDARNAAQRYLQNGDRRIDRADGTMLHPYQAQDSRLGNAIRQTVEPLIQRDADWRTSQEDTVGRIDLQGYRDWLARELGWDLQSPT